MSKTDSDYYSTPSPSPKRKHKEKVLATPTPPSSSKKRKRNNGAAPKSSSAKKDKRKDKRKRLNRKNPRSDLENMEIINKVPYPKPQVEKLVLCVEEKPELWEKECNEFYDIFLKAESWDKIAKATLLNNGK